MICWGGFFLVFVLGSDVSSAKGAYSNAILRKLPLMSMIGIGVSRQFCGGSKLWAFVVLVAMSDD